MTLDQPTLYQISPEQIGLDGRERELVNLLLRVWQSHIGGNVRNESYYGGKVRPAAVGADDPKELQNLRMVSGWGGKCVDALAGRSVLTGFRSDGTAAGDVEGALGGIDLAELYAQAVTSELTDSCSFLTVSAGLAGEPDVIVSAHSALDASAIWDERRKRIRAGMCVVDIAETPEGGRVPSWINVYTDDATYSCRLVGAGLYGARWTAEKVTNPLRRPLMEPLRYRPTLTRPFGRSRITPAARSIIDRALCVAARTEVTGVFYTWPMRYLLGVDKKTAEQMSRRKVEVYADRMMLVTANRNGDVPRLGQLSQATMQPHIDHLEMLAKQLASEASVPLDELGIVFDNPSSADAMYAAQQRLIIEAEGVNRMNGIALRNVALMALACMRGTDVASLSEADRSISARFENPMRPSMAARADYAIKVASSAPAYSQTEHFWRDLGYDEADVRSIMADIRYAQAAQAVTRQASQAASSAPAPEPEGGAPE